MNINQSELNGKTYYTFENRGNQYVLSFGDVRGHQQVTVHTNRKAHGGAGSINTFWLSDILSGMQGSKTLREAVAFITDEAAAA
jgi:hypothetical protein